MRVERLALLVACLASATFAQVRTWGFFPDTVRHRDFGTQDTLRAMNTGVDTLRFDSIHLELVRPTAQNFQVIFYPVPRTVQTQPYVVSHDSGKVTFSWLGSTPDPRMIAIRPQDTARFSGFKVGRHPLIVSKRAAIEPGDTVVVRMIFIASGGRGRDTLTVVGTEDIPLGVRPGVGETMAGKHRFDRFDPLGRRVDPVPDGARIPMRPVVSPKE